MKMKAVYEDLDEAKAEIENLKKQYRDKVELVDTLKRAHNDQLSINKEASRKLDKLAEELNRKEDEISNATKMCEELKSDLIRKESIVRHLSSAHDKLRSDCSEKVEKCEEENKALASALDNANTKNADQEQRICALTREIEGVRRLLASSSSKKKKCSESDDKAGVREELERRGDAFFKLEDEKRIFEDRLKWKSEQFFHLEDAHKKLRDEFKTKEKEWETEKIALLDDISSLHANLESQTRISRDLGHRFEMCKQALAHSENKIKSLEVQLSESRTRFEDVLAEYEEAKSNFNDLIARRDREISNTKGSSGEREILYKEMEYRLKKSERENRELSISLKELQENCIREAGFSHSSSKLRNKLKSLEHAHKGCSMNLEAKESELRAQIERLSEELNSCKVALKNNEVNKNNQKDLDYEPEKVAIFSENLDKMQREVERLGGLLDESKAREARSEERVVQIQRDLKSVHDALDRANGELDEKQREMNEIEFELQIWKSIAERLDLNLERNLQMRREVEASLFAQTEVEMNLRQERENLRRRLGEKAKLIDNLHQQLVDVKTARNEEENEASARDVAGHDENTPERIHRLVEEKDQRICDLQRLVTSLETEFESSTLSFSSKLSQMQKERNTLRESWECTKSGEVFKEAEIREKNLVIAELENDLRNSRRRAAKREEALFSSENKIREIQVELETKIEASDENNSELLMKMEKLSSTMRSMSEKIDRITVEDVKLMGDLGKIVETFDVSSDDDDHEEESVKENVSGVLSSSSSPLMKRAEGIHEERSPFRAINC